MFSIVGILGLCIAVLIVYISKTSLRNTVEASKTNAVSIIDQYKTLRGYYVKSVIKKVKANTDLKISHDHKVVPNAIPLPATLIHDMSALLSRKGDDKIRLRLYSEYPFPNRKGRSLDGFAQEAIAYFKGNPDGVFVREGKMGGKEMVRVAIADKMVAQACVNCHNSRPDTPKADWKLNDVRGVLEVISPIDSQLANNSSMLNNMIRAKYKHTPSRLQAKELVTKSMHILMVNIVSLTLMACTCLDKINMSTTIFASSTTNHMVTVASFTRAC